MRYELRRVDRIPRELEPGIVYHSEEYELGALLCACGCGHRQLITADDLIGHLFVCPSCGAAREIEHTDDLVVLAVVTEAVTTAELSKNGLTGHRDPGSLSP